MHARSIKWTCFGLLLLCFSTVHAELWHVWYMLRNCSTHSMQARGKHLDYMKNAAFYLKQEPDELKEHHEIHNKEKLLAFYSRTSATASVFCTVLPHKKEVSIDIYAPEKSFDREFLKKFTSDFFDTTESTQTTQYLPD